MDFYDRLNRNVFLNEFLMSKIKPDIAVTLTMKQAIDHGYGRIEFLTREKASSNVRHFMNLLNRKVHGSAASRRFGLRLPVVTAIEGDDHGEGAGQRLHVHMAMALPDFYDKNSEFARLRFRSLISSCWLKTYWGREEMDFQICSDSGGWLRYMMKNGTESLDLNNVFF